MKKFDECKRQIKKLNLEEKKTKDKLERIQKNKLKCVRILLDDKYCEKILKGEVND